MHEQHQKLVFHGWKIVPQRQEKLNNIEKNTVILEEECITKLFPYMYFCSNLIYVLKDCQNSPTSLSVKFFVTLFGVGVERGVK